MDIARKKSFTDFFLNSKLLMGIYILPFVEPIYCNYLHKVDLFFNLCYIAALCLFFLIMLENKFKVSRALSCLIAFFFTVSIVTIFASYSETLVINYIGKSIILCCAADISMKKHNYKFIETLQFILECIIFINLISILMFPNGLYTNATDYIVNTENWFMGFKNVQIRTMLPAITLSLANSYRKCGKITVRSWLLYIIVCVSTFLTKSSTAIVGIVLFSIIAICLRYQVWRKLFSIKTALIGMITIFLLIYFFHIQNAFSFLLEDVLGKDVTFHNRLIIWSRSVSLISKNILGGIGCQPTDEYYALLGAPHSHNYYLHTMLTGGIIGGLFIIGFYFTISKKLVYAKRSIAAIAFQSMIISFFIMGLTESLTATNIIYPIILLAYYVNLFDDGGESVMYGGGRNDE